jgi:hypothetical protein
MFPVSLGAAVVLALALAGCESDGGIAGRSQEKSAVYSSLKPWQKKYIDKGTVAEGFTPDMVYIAMGKADKVEAKDLPAGKTEIWTYSRYYPTDGALRGMHFTNFNTDSAYSAQATTTQIDPATGKTVPLGMATGGGQSIAKTGGPQGGSMEPANLASYTIQIMFVNGVVTKMAASPNIN